MFQFQFTYLIFIDKFITQTENRILWGQKHEDAECPRKHFVLQNKEGSKRGGGKRLRNLHMKYTFNEFSRILNLNSRKFRSYCIKSARKQKPRGWPQWMTDKDWPWNLLFLVFLEVPRWEENSPWVIMIMWPLWLFNYWHYKEKCDVHYCLGLKDMRM